MKKIGLLALTLLGYSASFFAQQHVCGTDSRLHKTFEANPAAVQQFIEHNTRISQGQTVAGDRTDPVIIPVVVHVLHDNGIGNISYEQIVSGIDQLNEDYNQLNADATDTRNTPNAPFAPVSASVDISFALAKIDPNGLCTNGIERRNSPAVTYNGGENAKYYDQGGLDAWPRDSYLNIWIVNTIESDGGVGITLGYAEFPQFATDGYGIIIRHDSYGTMGTASGDRTLTHEVGHCLGLLHTFQGPFFGGGTSGCHTTDCSSAGDFCCDTPPADAAHWDCPSSYNSCTGVPVNDFYGMDVYDQWENFMSYAPCQNMFSQGQADIINGNLSSISFLEELVSLDNQAETGVLSPAVLCKADFHSDVQSICEGNSVNFIDESFFNVTGWTWTFEGGTPATSNDQHPSVTYDAAGSYDVLLEATDGITTVGILMEDYILVLPDPGDGIPYHESFENLSSVPDNDRFLVQNGNGGTTWTLTSTAAYTGTYCAYLQNHGTTDGSKDELISGTIDLSSVDPSDDLLFTFRYAYKRKSAGNDEWLKLFVSKDCGQTWVLRKNLHGSTMGPLTSSGPYTPSTPQEWTEVTVDNITSDFYVADFRYKFEFTNDAGNNMYIDHINMYPASMAGISESPAVNQVQVYPNPATEQTTLSFVTSSQNNCEINVFDALGNIVASVYSGPLAEGNHAFQLNTAVLAEGIYMIRITGDTATQTIKLITE